VHSKLILGRSFADHLLDGASFAILLDSHTGHTLLPLLAAFAKCRGRLALQALE
jgi:hypothetical protein